MAACTCADPMAVAAAVSGSGALIASSINGAAGNVSSTMQALNNKTLQQDSNHHEGTMAKYDEIHSTMYGASMGGSAGAPAPVRFAHAAPPEYGPEGESKWTTFFQAASLAIALANSIAQGEIAAKQRDLADRYYDMAKSKWDRFERYYMALEKKLLNEVASEPERFLHCDLAQSRAETAVSTAYGAASAAFARWAKRSKCCVVQDTIAEFSRQEMLMTVDTMAYNLEDDRWFADYSNDKRWNRRSSVLNLGRNMAAEALKYGDVSMKTFGTVGGQINTAASGIISALGYYGARNDTYYPTTFMASYGNSGNAMLINTALQQNHNATNTLNSTR